MSCDDESTRGILGAGQKVVNAENRAADVYAERRPVIMISAQRSPLTIALSRLAGQPVSVQAPARSRLGMGLRWIGRRTFVPGGSGQDGMGRSRAVLIQSR